MAGAPPLRPPAQVVGGTATYASMVQPRPQQIPEVQIEMRQPMVSDGSLWFHFSKSELEQAAAPFRFSVVLKFLRRRPTLDQIRLFIRTRWGIKGFVSVSAMQRSRNIFIRFSTEEDFCTACSRESSDIEGAPYRLFIWSSDFDENLESSLVPVWLFLPGLPPQYYHESMLRIITGAFGRFLKRDNFTACASRTDGARVCVEIDISKPLVDSFWLGVPHHPSSRYQEVVYEKMPLFCHWCRTQGHVEETCKKKKATEGLRDPENLTKQPKKIWRRKEGEIEDVLAPKIVETEQIKLKKQDLLLKCGRVIHSTQVMFTDSNGCVHDAVEAVDDYGNVFKRSTDQQDMVCYVDKGNGGDKALSSGKINKEIDVCTPLMLMDENGVSKENFMEQAILRGEIDAIHEVVVMNELERIADVVVREDDSTDLNMFVNQMASFGPDMSLGLEIDNWENERGFGPYHTQSDGASGDDLPAMEFLNYETEMESMFPARKRRSKNRKKVVLGITTRSKKFY